MPTLKTWTQRVLWAASGLLAATTLLKIAVAFGRYSNLYTTAGVWTAHALDLTHGVFYRPLHGELGYGGSRYAPLFFLLHSLLIPIIGDPMRAGRVVSILSLAALLGGAYALMRRLGVAPRWALPWTALILSGKSIQTAATTIRGDGLAAALNVAGLAFCAGETEDRRRLAAASVCFALAPACKITAVFAFAAAGMSLLLAGRRREAVRLTAWTLSGMAGIWTIILLASHGRALVPACISSGLGWHSFLRVPARLLFHLSEDKITVLLLTLSLAAVLSRPRQLRGLPTLALLATAAATTAILASPGTDYNHLIDLNVVAVVALAAQLAARRWERPWLAAVLALITLASVRREAKTLLWSALADGNRLYAEVAEDIAQPPGTVLSNNAWPVILANRPVYMLDPFLFRVLAQSRPALAEPLWAGLKARAFTAVVLQYDLDAFAGRMEYKDRHFGWRFIQTLQKYYKPVSRHGRFTVYRPR